MLTEEQQRVYDVLIDWLKNGTDKKSHIVVGGYAGTGKTYLISQLKKNLNKKIALVSFTGKASSVLKQKIFEAGINPANTYIGTIHSLIYKPITKYSVELKMFVVVDWELKYPEEIDYDLIIVDEASMVSRELWEDLRFYKIPIIAFGDHGQLPPVGSEFSLMKNPDLFLTEIHRQALESPILKLSKFVRITGMIPNNVMFGPGVVKVSWNLGQTRELWESVDFGLDTIVLCGFNKTRVALNNDIRKRRGFNKILPYPGEPIICLKNNRDIGIMNGEILNLMWLHPSDLSNSIGIYKSVLNNHTTTEPIECLLSKKCFGKDLYDLTPDKQEAKIFRKVSKDNECPILFFDYGYVTSVHKSQGSEWDRVVLFEQRTKMWDDEYYKKWLYTAVTRAKNKLLIISDCYDF